MQAVEERRSFSKFSGHGMYLLLPSAVCFNALCVSSMRVSSTGADAYQVEEGDEAAEEAWTPAQEQALVKAVKAFPKGCVCVHQTKE